MKRAAVVSLLLLVLAGCSSSRKTPEATQENFGVNMARMNLWREALFRFNRAVQMNPGDATAHNNLAVAYEANGDFESAAKEYREAMRLDKANTYIQKNYSRFVEFNSRNKKRQQKKDALVPKTAAATSTPVAPAAPAPDATPPAVPATVSGDAPGSTAQPTGTAPATVPPAAPPPPQVTPTKPPGDHP